MKLLRIVSTFKTKKGTDIARQTNFVKLSDFNEGKEVEILLRGKKADKITLKIIGKEEVEARVAQMDRA